MASISRSRPQKIATALAVAAALGGVIAWALSSSANTQEPAAKPFWQYLAPHASEVKVPNTVEEIAQRGDTIVLAHVTGVGEGRDDKACLEVASTGNCSIPKTVFVQLTIDRVVHGSVRKDQVLNLEMFRPPNGIDAIRGQMPPGRALFFLAKTTPVVTQQSMKDVYGIVSLRSVIAQGPQGLFPALEPSSPGLEGFIQSFQATTIEQAADRAAQARAR